MVDVEAESTRERVSKDTSRKMMTRIDSHQAADIARRFFERYHSGVEIKDIELNDEIWLVTVGVGFLFENVKKIEIDANTGVILRYY